MAARRAPTPAALEERLGHRFSDLGLLRRALTHVSAGTGPETYQRLEFLGDRVLGLCIADLLCAAYPQASEGELSRRLSELVRKETCAEVAAEWDVGPHLKIGAGEAHAGMRRNRSVLADACEALIGAVYLDAGPAAARALVERAFADRLRAQSSPPVNAKAALQEWAQGRGLPTPTYALSARLGPDHAPRFHIRASVAGLGSAVGVGASKRVAEQDAARALLVEQGVWAADAEGAAEAPTTPNVRPARATRRRVKLAPAPAGEDAAETNLAEADHG